MSSRPGGRSPKSSNRNMEMTSFNPVTSAVTLGGGEVKSGSPIEKWEKKSMVRGLINVEAYLRLIFGEASPYAFVL